MTSNIIHAHRRNIPHVTVEGVIFCRLSVPKNIDSKGKGKKGKFPHYRPEQALGGSEG